MYNATNVVDDKIHQVKVDSDVKKYCFTDKCVLAGIDTKDAVNLEMTLGFLENLKRIYFGKGVRVTFAWFDSNAVGEKLVNDFKISGQSPSLLLLSQSKYLSLSSPITKTKSIKLVDDFLAGKGQTYNFKVQLNEERSEL